MSAAGEHPGAAALSGIPVVILAAGRGSRMGGPKAFLDVNGQPWWRIQQEKLKRLGVRPVWVIVPGDWVSMPEGRWVGVQPGEPMFESVRAGMATVVASARDATPPGVFVLPIDVPVAGRMVWNGLLEALQAPPGARPIAPSYRSQGGHPLLLPWSWAVDRVPRAPAGARLDEMCRDSLSVVEVLDPGVTTNLNTPEDVLAWKQSNPRG